MPVIGPRQGIIRKQMAGCVPGGVSPCGDEPLHHDSAAPSQELANENSALLQAAAEAAQGGRLPAARWAAHSYGCFRALTCLRAKRSHTDDAVGRSICALFEKALGSVLDQANPSQKRALRAALKEVRLLVSDVTAGNKRPRGRAPQGKTWDEQQVSTKPRHPRCITMPWGASFTQLSHSFAGDLAARSFRL